MHSMSAVQGKNVHSVSAAILRISFDKCQFDPVMADGR